MVVCKARYSSISAGQRTVDDRIHFLCGRIILSFFKTLLPLIFLFQALCFLMPVPAQAGGQAAITMTITPPLTDTYIDQVNQNSNYGSSAIMQINPKQNYLKRSLIRFDLSTIPMGSDVQTAKLYIYIESVPPYGAYSLYNLTSDWSESAVTWLSRDGIHNWSSPGGDFSSSNAGTAATPSAPGWMLWWVNKAVQGWITDGQANYGWCIKDKREREKNNYSGSLATKESLSPNKPYLQITYAAKTWESYDNFGRTTVSDTFRNSDQSTVYMKGSGFIPGHQYKIAYYDANTDGGGHLVKVDSGTLALANAAGALNNSFCHFPDYPGAIPGMWHTVVFYNGANSAPGTYHEATASSNRIADDSFFVTAGAIPEFSSILGAIGVCGACGITYIFMRKKRCLCGSN